MKKRKMAVTGMDKPIAELAERTDKKTLAIWALDCAERVLPYFEDKCLEDGRPRRAIEAGRSWIRTGVFKMADIRKDSLGSHAAAREVKDDAARSAARSAGQALATAHVAAHALAAAIYAATAVRDATNADSDAATVKEREWQYQHLIRLQNPIAIN